jgi:hypothetical protein
VRKIDEYYWAKESCRLRRTFGMEDNISAARLRRDLARYRSLLTVAPDDTAKRFLTALIIETEMRLGAVAQEDSGAHAPRERRSAHGISRNRFHP